MLRWIVAPAAAPVGGLVVGVVAFVGALRATPPGLPSPYWMVVAPSRNPIGITAAFATGAAAALALIAVGAVAGLLVATRAISLAIEARRGARG